MLYYRVHSACGKQSSTFRSVVVACLWCLLHATLLTEEYVAVALGGWFNDRSMLSSIWKLVVHRRFIVPPLIHL
uniref:Putative secreted peptide n=1 Tax=Anopheles braziliensis TaxID=58242 RepID=A0A2M3ZRW7_9DIPT